MYPVTVVLQYIKKQNNTYTHSKQYTTHKIIYTITQNYKQNAHKITNIIQHNNTENTKHTKNKDTTVVKVTLS
jgi:hypothetical protein